MLTKILIKSASFLEKSGVLENFFFRSAFFFFYELYKRFWEDPFVLFFKNNPELVVRGHIIDVGANIGYTARVFCKLLAGAPFYVLCFEPAPSNFANLKRRMAGFGERCKCFRLALGAVSGIQKFYLSSEQFTDHKFKKTDSQVSSSGEFINVQVVSGDEFLPTQIDVSQIGLIKIDVQGYELSVLKGLYNVIRKSESLIVIFEFDPRALMLMGHNPDEIFDFFLEVGYHTFEVDRRGNVKKINSDRCKLIKLAGAYTNILAVRANKLAKLRLSSAGGA